MSRAKRLLDLIQTLRSYRRPVSGAVLADAMGTSLRTLYRDIETLKAQGAPIDGEAGIGFVLRPGFMLPPLMFSEEEIEAITIGVQWVAERADSKLGNAAHQALMKIAAVLPPDLRAGIDMSGLIIGPSSAVSAGDTELPAIRSAIRKEHKLHLSYVDERGTVTMRTIWPIALAFFEKVRIVVAWCELRVSFRHFRTDRITELTAGSERYPRRRNVLLKEWRASQGIPGDN